MTSRETQMIEWMDAVRQINDLTDAELADVPLADREQLAKAMMHFPDFAPKEQWDAQAALFKRLTDTLLQPATTLSQAPIKLPKPQR